MDCDNSELKMRLKAVIQNCIVLRHKIKDKHKEYEEAEVILKEMQRNCGTIKLDIQITEQNINCMKKSLKDESIFKYKKEEHLTNIRKQVFENRLEIAERAGKKIEDLENKVLKSGSEDLIDKGLNEKLKKAAEQSGKAESLKFYISCCRKKLANNNTDTSNKIQPF